MKYFVPIVVWYTAVFLHIILTLNVEEVRTLQHLQNVKNINFCYDAGLADVNMRHVKGSRLKSEILKTVKTIPRIHCVLNCSHDQCCRSVNFKRSSVQKEIGDCELLHDVKNSSSSELEKDEMYEHIPLFDPRKEYMICCKICNGSGTFRPESATCYCTPTDNGKRYVKAIYKCVPNLCHANATCQNNGDSFVCVCKKGFVAALKNVALNKMTNQSSTAGGLGISDHAVDGNNNPSYFSGSCTHTNSTGTSPWWMVDLGQEDIHKHLLISRETRKIICPAPMKGRYVIIRIPGTTIALSLCEVEVYGEYIGPMKECI